MPQEGDILWRSPAGPPVDLLLLCLRARRTKAACCMRLQPKLPCNNTLVLCLQVTIWKAACSGARSWSRTSCPAAACCSSQTCSSHPPTPCVAPQATTEHETGSAAAAAAAAGRAVAVPLYRMQQLQQEEQRLTSHEVVSRAVCHGDFHGWRGEDSAC
jgi:hypothetical protein